MGSIQPVSCRNADQAVLPPDLHNTQLVLLEAQYYQLTGLIQLLQKYEEQLKQVCSSAAVVSTSLLQQAGVRYHISRRLWDVHRARSC